MTLSVIDLCAGSGPVTARVMGADAFLPWQGSKRFYIPAIEQYLGIDLRQASSVSLAEASPWSIFWQVLGEHGPLAMAEALRQLEVPDDKAREAFLSRRAATHSSRPMTWTAWEPTLENAALWLWLTQRSYSGKGPHAGFCPREIAPTPNGLFGKWRYQPNDPLRKFLAAGDWSHHTKLRRVMFDVHDITPEAGHWVFCDPPFVGTTGYRYGTGLDRPAVLGLARRWRDAGSSVVIHEAQPLAELEAEGWESTELLRSGQPARNRSKTKREFITVWRAKS